MSADNEKDYIQLDQFLKLISVVASGGEAKHLIREGLILVNGEVETRRGRKLRCGDLVEFEGQKFTVSL